MSTIFGQGRGLIIDTLASTRNAVTTINLGFDALHSKALDLHDHVTNGAEDRREAAAEYHLNEFYDMHAERMLDVENRINANPRKAEMVRALQLRSELRKKEREEAAKKAD